MRNATYMYLPRSYCRNNRRDYLAGNQVPDFHKILGKILSLA